MIFVFLTCPGIVYVKTITSSVLTSMSSIVIRATEQWLLATKSTLTPNIPAHRRSPATAQSPMESLPRQALRHKPWVMIITLKGCYTSVYYCLMIIAEKLVITTVCGGVILYQLHHSPASQDIEQSLPSSLLVFLISFT
jgi:hypothetical protein